MPDASQGDGETNGRHAGGRGGETGLGTKFSGAEGTFEVHAEYMCGVYTALGDGGAPARDCSRRRKCRWHGPVMVAVRIKLQHTLCLSAVRINAISHVVDAGTMILTY
jgi:hypothetical protein